MKTFIRLATFFLLPYLSTAQTPEQFRASEAFDLLYDSTMQSEIATFSKKGAELWGCDSLLRQCMIEIPVKSCDESQVYFSHPKKIGAYINLYVSNFEPEKHLIAYEGGTDSVTLIDGKPYWGTKGDLPERKIDSVFFVLHSHFLVPFPKDAFDGICNPPACRQSETPRRKRGIAPSTAPGFKLFRSKITHNTYLYVLGGSDDAQYEAVWILQNDRYYRRLVDELN